MKKFYSKEQNEAIEKRVARLLEFCMSPKSIHESLVSEGFKNSTKDEPIDFKKIKNVIEKLLRIGPEEGEKPEEPEEGEKPEEPEKVEEPEKIEEPEESEEPEEPEEPEELECYQLVEDILVADYLNDTQKVTMLKELFGLSE